MKSLVLFVALTVAAAAHAGDEFLVKFKDGFRGHNQLNALQAQGASIESLGFQNWVLVRTQNEAQAEQVKALKDNKAVMHVQPNYKVHLIENYRQSQEMINQIIDAMNHSPRDGWEDLLKEPAPDNPAIPAPIANGGSGSDPLFSKQWGMNDIGVQQAVQKAKGDGIIVAVIDTGVDYTHEDLGQNIWRNPGEIADNQIDDDHNGYVDDVIGWDFVSNDNKPYDFTTSKMALLQGEGNPGHGTHCAGNVAARGNNGLGISGVAPQATIMPVRFLSEKGSGDIATAVKSIKYAVDNGAKVLSNSWGSNGEDPNDAANNQALKDIIKYAQDHNVIFVAAAGNGDDQGKGYDNDSSSQPGIPASYDMENIISVAAVDKSNNLGSFSNWGARTVDIGAPGVDVFSTISGGGYNDVVLDLSFMGGGVANWDGTSMATPHVAGAAALYWSAHPQATWKEVKDAILATATPISSLQGKVVSNGKLNVQALMEHP
jgi:subtilisin family serine protease